MSAGLPPAGWYDDPEYGGQLRWWDGTAWTNDRRPASQPQQAQAPVAVNDQAGATGAGYGSSTYGASTYDSSTYGASAYGRPDAGVDVIPGELGSAGDRLVAVLIDAGVVIAAVLAVMLVGAVLGAVSRSLGNAVSGLGLIVVYGFYFIALIMGEGRLGQSYGRHLAGLKVVSLRDGRPIGSAAAFGRLIVRALGSYVFFLGVLWILWDDKRQGWHDKALNTVVIKDKGARKLDPIAYFRAVFTTKR
jgi:uncharacterized RDD family membrane protein YckC